MIMLLEDSTVYKVTWNVTNSKYKGHPCLTEALLFTSYCRKNS